MESTTDTSSGFGRGALQLAASNAVYVLAAYVTTTGLARVLEPSAFGGFGVVMSWITVLTALLVKGLATSVARQMADASDAGDVATIWRAGRSLAIGSSTLLACIGVALAPVVARVVDAPDLTAELAIGALGALTFGTNAALLAWPIGLRRYGRQAVAQLAYACARLALVLGGGIAFGLEGAVVGYVLAPLVSSLSVVARVPRATSRAELRRHRAVMLRMLAPVSLVSIAITAYFVVDVFALSAAVGGSAHQVGVYVAYGTLAHVPFFLLQATSVAMVPAIVAARDHAVRLAAIRRTLTDTIVLLAGPTLLLVTAGDASARVVFGSDYDTTGLVVAPLAIATAAVTWMAGLVAVDVALDRMRGSLAVTGAGVVLVAASCWFAADRADAAATASAAAWAAAASTVLAVLVLAVRARVRIGAIIEGSRALRGLVAMLAAAGPLVAPSDRWALAMAIACAIAWLVAVLRLRIVDVRRAAPSVDETAASSGM